MLATKRIDYCFECSSFPCNKLERLDKHYREKYGMSMIENLRQIQTYGVKQFLKSEQERWECPACGGIICVHNKTCYTCKGQEEKLSFAFKPKSENVSSDKKWATLSQWDVRESALVVQILLGGLSKLHAHGGEKLPKVIHFEIPAEDTKRAIGFYEKTFGWKFNKYGGEATDYWLVTMGEDVEPGINGAFLRRSTSHYTTVNTISVTSLEDAAKEIKAAGGEVLGPKMAVPSVGYMTYCKDMEGNIFGIMQMDPKAK
jgi:predicted enzyme related to lactoylglutathione lyase